MTTTPHPTGQINSPLFKLPTELLVATLCLITPADLLSLARTCTKFHTFLVSPSSSHIWRHIRESFMTIDKFAIGKPGSTDMRLETHYWQTHLGRLEVVPIPGQDVAMHLRVVHTLIPAPCGTEVAVSGMPRQTEHELASMLFGSKECVSTLERSFIEENYIEDHDALAEYGQQAETPVNATVGEELFFKLWDAILKEKMHGPAIYPGRPVRHCALRTSWISLLVEFQEMKKPGRSADLKRFLEVDIPRRMQCIRAREEHALKLVEWYEKYKTYSNIIENCLSASSELFASFHGFNLEDMQESPAYKATISVAKRLLLPEISPMLVPILSDLTSQVLEIQATRIVTSIETTQKVRRAQIEALYERYSFPDKIRPTLAVFCAIPILQSLQDGISPKGVLAKDPNQRKFKPVPYNPIFDVLPSISGPEGWHWGTGIKTALGERATIKSDLEKKLVLNLLHVGVQQWREGAIRGARQLLGFQGVKPKKSVWKKDKRMKEIRSFVDIDHADATMEEREVLQSLLGPDMTMDVDVVGTGGSRGGDGEGQERPRQWHSAPGRLDPEMRVTSWFVCKRCTSLDSGYRRICVLDFRGLCAHECSQKGLRKAEKSTWNIARFSLAPRAIDAAKKMLEVLGLDKEDPTTTSSLEGWWTCDNCPVWMNAMTWKDLLRHCQRHETQRIAWSSDEEVRMRREALGCTGGELTFVELLSGRHEMEARIRKLACVHCHPAWKGDGEGLFGIDIPKPSKLMDIYGIRQHMKAKHQVLDCGGEDYYRAMGDQV